MAHETLLQLATAILLFPLIGFMILIFLGKRIGKPAGVIGSTILGIDLLMAIVVAYTKLVTYSGEKIIQTKFEWFRLTESISITVGIGIDNLTVIMLLVVTLISFLVHMFSTEYMDGDKRYPRFYAYLGLFTFSMLGIVLANNFLFMYVFWELVGISSYLLIGFWYEKDSAANASKKAFITNRIGDFGFLMGILILYTTYGSFMFDDVFAQMARGVIPFDNETSLTIAGMCIFCGAVGKSAQFPLHVWLPDAMEGPTPVSALIHAATMVAAGVYLVARVFPMFTADALTLIAYIGAITAFIAATIALTQTDFKKVLAYSTVSQLGYMVMALGVGSYTNGFFHLITHAWFKAALFLGSGSVIHAMHHAAHHMNDYHTDPQDINNMGGLRKTMPWTYLTFLFATIAISGVPFTSGFLSKDGILAGTLAYAKLTGHWFIPLAGFGAAGLTAFYMFRLTILAFHGDAKTPVATHTKENKKVIVMPLVVLAVLSFWFWYSPNPIDATKGWFHAAVKQPATAVPASAQWDFLLMEAPAAETAHEATLPATETAALAHEAQATEAHATEAATAEAHTAHHYMNKYEEAVHHEHYPAMILSLLIAGCGILFSFCLYQFKLLSPDSLERQFKPLHKFSLNKWYFDELYQATAIGGTVILGKFLALFDNKVVDGVVNLTAGVTRVGGYFTGYFDLYVVDGLVNLIANVTGFFGAALRKFQTGRIQTYLIFAIIGLMALIYFVI